MQSQVHPHHRHLILEDDQRNGVASKRGVEELHLGDCGCSTNDCPEASRRVIHPRSTPPCCFVISNGALRRKVLLFSMPWAIWHSTFRSRSLSSGRSHNTSSKDSRLCSGFQVSFERYHRIHDHLRAFIGSFAYGQIMDTNNGTGKPMWVQSMEYLDTDMKLDKRIREQHIVLLVCWIPRAASLLWLVSQVRLPPKYWSDRVSQA